MKRINGYEFVNVENGMFSGSGNVAEVECLRCGIVLYPCLDTEEEAQAELSSACENCGHMSEEEASEEKEYITAAGDAVKALERFSRIFIKKNKKEVKHVNYIMSAIWRAAHLMSSTSGKGVSDEKISEMALEAKRRDNWQDR